MLYYAMLCYAMLYYTILYYTILYYTILYYTILYYTILYYTVPYYTILCYTVLYCTIVYYTILQSLLRPLEYSDSLGYLPSLPFRSARGPRVIGAVSQRAWSKERSAHPARAALPGLQLQRPEMGLDNDQKSRVE